MINNLNRMTGSSFEGVLGARRCSGCLGAFWCQLELHTITRWRSSASTQSSAKAAAAVSTRDTQEEKLYILQKQARTAKTAAHALEVEVIREAGALSKTQREQKLNMSSRSDGRSSQQTRLQLRSYVRKRRRRRRKNAKHENHKQE
jgi:hypothetical protein